MMFQRTVTQVAWVSTMLVMNGPSGEFSEAQVRKVTRLNDPISDGVMKGLLTGVIGGVISGIATAGAFSDGGGAGGGVVAVC